MKMGATITDRKIDLIEKEMEQKALFAFRSKTIPRAPAQT